ncbi:MAG: class I SAM-dependent methyltransferase [Shewanella algae]
MVSIGCDKHSGPLLDEVGGFQVIDCQVCGFKHVHPLPTAAELETVYRHEYYVSDKPLFIKEGTADSQWWQQVYSDRFDTLEDCLPENERRILDVGSGPGFFIQHGQQRGWSAIGIEPSVRACEHARSLGTEVVEDFFTESSAAKLGKFNAIHANAVLEHIPNPIEMLALMRESLVSGGVLCVVVPNDYNPFQETLREIEGYRPWWVAPPHHLNFFDFDSLGNLLEKMGFDVFLKETTFPMDMFLLMGDNYVDDGQLGRACHQKRIRFDKQLNKAGRNSSKRAFYQALANAGLGREVVLFARKV